MCWMQYTVLLYQSLCAIDFRTAGGAWDSTSGIKAGDGFKPLKLVCLEINCTQREKRKAYSYALSLVSDVLLVI